VGALYDAFNKVGAGLPERYYYSLFKEQLNKREIKYREQVKVSIAGLPVKLGRFYLDFIIDGKIVVELKVGSRFYKQSVDQIMAYLRQSGLKLGILARFGNDGVSTKRFLLGQNV
jgi:GxxExxY protein